MKRLLCVLLLLALLSGCSTVPAETTCPEAAPIETTAVTETTEPPPELPDCLAYAEILSRTHGITILVAQDVQRITPWDYDLETEDDPVVLYRELQRLERCLENYPEGMLRTLSRSVNGLHLSIVRGIYGKEGLGGLPAAAGLQYQEENRIFIAVTSGMPTPHTLYHELFHIMDNYILNHTRAYDRWNSLNPADFQYDYNYSENLSRDGSPYLQPQTRAFIDSYAMSFPEEDRARIMEYAMTPGNRWLFETPVMQQKLALLSAGIRQAFGLEPQEELLWEQYLRKE